MKPADIRSNTLSDDKVWRSSGSWPALQSLCMRAGQIAILWIAFTGLLSAQTAPQGPMGPTGKTESFKDVAADKIYAITEGQGIKETVALPVPGSISC